MHAENISTERRALIIEDEILIAEELRERLWRLGFFVIGAVDPPMREWQSPLENAPT
jgi:hypothetical protein